jgi:Na+-transporting NADH:ubiquinone oxidoreductase subunit C
MTIKNSKFSVSNRSSLSGSRQDGFLKLPNDNMIKTIGVATLLCLVCSIIVSGAATMLKPQQVVNKLLDKKRNILMVAGISDDSKTVNELFARIDAYVVDMSTGEFTDAVDAETFDQRKAANDAEYRVGLNKSQDIASIGAISKYGNVYLLRDGDAVSKIILPIRGYGLWSTMYGFIALESDARTVSGITFYEHAETPGLGGEIENEKWLANWDGKFITDLQGNPELRLVKGGVTESTPNSEYKVEGIAGATLTSNGVSNLIKFWMGEDAFGPFLERVRSGNGQVSVITPVNSEKG